MEILAFVNLHLIVERLQNADYSWSFRPKAECLSIRHSMHSEVSVWKMEGSCVGHGQNPIPDGTKCWTQWSSVGVVCGTHGGKSQGLGAAPHPLSQQNQFLGQRRLSIQRNLTGRLCRRLLVRCSWDGIVRTSAITVFAEIIVSSVMWLTAKFFMEWRS